MKLATRKALAVGTLRATYSFRTELSHGRLLNLMLASIVGWLSVAATLEAQDFTGFRGRVTDSSGAVVAAAAVKATEETSGLSSSTVSNSSGEYELQGLLPGTYRLEIELAGFKKYVNRGAVVYARQPRRVDVQLEVGEVTESMTVEAQGARIATDTASTTYKISQRETKYLIHMGSNNAIGSVLYMATHNMPGTGEAGNGWGINNSVHGSYANSIITEQDGISTYGHGTFRNPAESVKEINNTAINGSAENRTATTIAAVGRSGTNQLHGEVFMQLRHPSLWALTTSQKGKPRPPASPIILWNYQLSGPVYIPKLYDGRNKTFFQFLYQPEGGVVNEYPRAIFPTPRMRAGDLSQALTGTGRNITNPFTGQPFANNIIPTGMISPIALNILKRVPLPNQGDFFGENFVSLSAGRRHTDWWQFKVDHQLFKNNTLSFSHYRFNSDNFSEWELQPLTRNQSIDFTRAISIQDTHTFSPSVVNQFIYTWNSQSRETLVGVTSGNDLLNEFGITNLGGRTPLDVLGTPYFAMQIMGFSGFGSLVAPGQNIFGRTANSGASSVPLVFGVKDSVSFQKGKHLAKTGLDIYWERPSNLIIPQETFGQWNFTGAMAGHEFADFLLGLPTTSSISITRPTSRAAQVIWGFFVQDDWKVTPNLTLTGGVRFQHYGPPIELNDLFYNFDFENRRVVVRDEEALSKVHPAWPKEAIPVVTAAQAGYPSNLVNFKTLMVEPRLGFAWRIGQKSVLRMGYGVYHVPYSAYSGTGGILSGRDAGPFQLTESFGPNRIVSGVPELTINGFPTAGSGAIPLQSVNGIPLDTRGQNWPDDQQWNVTMERDLGLGLTGRASYVGSKGTHWPYVRNLNVPTPSTVPFSQRPESERRPFGPNYANVLLQDLGGNSTYHGLELEVTRQFSKGLYLRGWYEWRKSLNDVDNGQYGSVAGRQIESPYNRAREKGWQENFQPQRGQIALVYDLPVGRGQRFQSNLSGVLNHILGNWTTGFKIDTYSQTRFTAIYTGADPANVGTSSGRPNISSGCEPIGVGPTPGQYWNRSCFSVPLNGTLGTSFRGQMHDPRVWQTFFNMFKKWNLTGKENGPYFQVDMYVFNLFNHRNAASLGPISNNIASPQFGFYSPDPWDSRKIHFRLKLGF